MPVSSLARAVTDARYAIAFIVIAATDGAHSFFTASSMPLAREFIAFTWLHYKTANTCGAALCARCHMAFVSASSTRGAPRRSIFHFMCVCVS